MSPLLDVYLPALHEGQQQVHESRARFKGVRAGRRWGKTRLASTAMVEVGLGMADWHPTLDGPGRAWWVPPTYKQAIIGWRQLSAFSMSIPGAKVWRSEMQVELPTGGSMGIRSADSQSGLRGEGLDFVVIEEATYVPERAWKEDLRPALADRQGAAMFIYTPRGYDWVYDLDMTTQEMPDWEFFHFPTHTNPYISEVELEAARRELGSHVYSQEFLAEYVELGGNVFKSDWFRYARQTELTDTDSGEASTYYILDDERVAATSLATWGIVDPAVTVKTSADYTVIGVFATTPSGKILVLDVIRDRWEGPDIVPAMHRATTKWNMGWIGIESVGGFKMLAQEARRAGLAVKELNPKGQDKLARALPLQARLEAGDVFFRQGAPWIDELERELLVFSGQPSSGQHDDQVDVLAYAASEASRRRTWAAY